MAKEVRAQIKLQVPGGAVTPGPPVGSSLSQYGVAIMEFCKQFNAQTASRKGETVPVVITIYKDKSFTFVVKSSPVTELIKKKINISKGSSKPNEQKAGRITSKDIEDIAKMKMADLNAHSLEQAKKIIAGSARSMGVEIID